MLGSCRDMQRKSERSASGIDLECEARWVGHRHRGSFAQLMPESQRAAPSVAHADGFPMGDSAAAANET
jgi:hypothetical protein